MRLNGFYGSERFIDMNVFHGTAKTLSSKKRYSFIPAVVVVVCVIACSLFILSGKSPSRDPAKLTDFINKHEIELVELAQRYPNQYKEMNSYLGIQFLDTRTDDVCFSFSWSFDIPEGGSFLYYANDGILESQGYQFTNNAFIDGLGIRGKGYIKCIMLKQNWFFVEYNIPT